MFSYVKNKQRELFVQEKISSGTVSSKDGLSLIYTWFRISGVHNLNRGNKYAFLLYAVVLYVVVVLYLPIAFMISFMVSEWDYSTLFTSIQVSINCIGNSTKVTALIFLLPKLLTSDEVLAKLDARCVSEDEFQLLHKMKKLGRNLMFIFCFIYMSYATSTCISSVVSGHAPYNIYLPFIDWKNSTWEFLVASFIEWTLMVGACFQEVANDVYAVAFVCIIRNHVNMLCMRMKRLGKDHEKTLEENCEELTMCIKDHKNIIELYEIVAPVISVTIFLQFTITAVILGCTLINILVFATTFSSKLASCIFVFAICTEIFPLCYCCNCLLLDIDKLADNIFHSSWISQSPNYRKMMRFFLQRAQQPMDFTAGKIYPINLASFISIAKFSFSLYTFIKQMDIKGRLGIN